MEATDIGNLFVVGQSTAGAFQNLDVVCGARVSFLNAQGCQACLNYGGGLYKLVSLAVAAAADGGALPFAVADASKRTGFVETQSSCGGAHIARSRLGAVYTWGVTAEGQRGTFRGPARAVDEGAAGGAASEPTLVARLDVGAVSVGAGRGHYAAVTAEGYGYTWGCDERGQLGLAPTSSQGRHLQVFGDLRTPGAPPRSGAGEYSGVPRVVASLSHIPLRSVTCGEDWTLFLSRAGDLYACGEGGCGQLGVGRVSSLLNPVRVHLEEGAGGAYDTEHSSSHREEDISFAAEELAVGRAHVLVRTASGHVFTWGLNAQGQLGVGDLETRFKPVLLRESRAAGGAAGGAALQSSPSSSPAAPAAPAAVVEKDSLDLQGIGEEEDSDGAVQASVARAVRLRAMLPVVAAQVAAGWAHSVVLTRTGRVLSFGCAEGGRLGHSYALAPAGDTVCPSSGAAAAAAAAVAPAPAEPQMLEPSSRAQAAWPFSEFGRGPLSCPKPTYAPYRDPPHMERNAAARAGLPPPTAFFRADGRSSSRGKKVLSSIAEAGTWSLPLVRTAPHAAMRVKGQAWLKKRVTEEALLGAGLQPPQRGGEEGAGSGSSSSSSSSSSAFYVEADPSLLAHNTLHNSAAVAARAARVVSVGMPWLRTPQPSPSVPPCTLPREIQQPLFLTRKVARVACGPADTYLFSR
jgi:alpha-tubulin suppressor-like RCC1 family protein